MKRKLLPARCALNLPIERLNMLPSPYLFIELVLPNGYGALVLTTSWTVHVFIALKLINLD